MKYKISSRKPLAENRVQKEQPEVKKPEKKAKKEKKNDPDKVS